jgi:hypothetical protein
MSWEPLLEGAIRDRATESVQAIREALSLLDGDLAEHPFLASGITGRAILHGYLAQADIAARCLQRATVAVANEATVASLYGGLAGLGWVLTHLQGRLPDLDGEDDTAEMDEVLLNHLNQSPWTDDYDLIKGLVGFGVYALERLAAGAAAARPAAVACLERVIDRLAETAERRAEGTTWWTDPAWLIPETREKYPRGYYNLGLAHGVPGVIALLGRALAAGVAEETARPLIDDAVRWLLAQQIDDDAGFPAWVAAETSATPARLAWCYGDAGVAVALLGTARSVSEPNWEREALAIAQRAAERPPDQAGVVDAGLCHGAAGLGHLFNRIFQATDDPRFAAAGRFWFERALAMRQKDCGIAGYSAWGLGKDGNMTWVDDPGLLTGAAGIALALLAAATPIEPAWDRVLLVAIPPAATL